MIQKIFAYNTGSLISGTTQVGDIAISEADVEYSTNFGGLEWWGGPDEELGYVITYPVPAGGHPTPISGLTSYIGFLGTKNMTNPFFESTFLDLVNTKFNQNFTSGNDASIWLTTNGYWNSWVFVTPNVTETPTNTPTPEPTTTPTNTETPTPTPTNTVSGWFFYGSEGIVLGPPSSNGNTVFIISGGTSTYNPNYTGTSMTLFFNNNDNAGTSYATQFQDLDTTGGTITMTQGVNEVTYSGTAAQFVYNGTYTSLEVSSLSQMIQSASTSFVSGSSINLTFNTLPSVTPTPTNTPEPTTTPTNTETPTNTPEPTTTPTNTETPTNTPTETPTNTPTPSASPIPVTGFGYNLVVLPYNPPTSGNTIFPTFANPELNSGTTNPNTFNINGIYWNSIDNTSVDRTSYYSGMTGVSVTAYFTQNGDTVIYSGSPTAFIYEGPIGQESFNYNPQTRPNELVLIQSASTNFVTGQTVYISYNVIV